MNKKLKIATAAVSVVMAGTMAFGMFGCSNGNGGGDSKPKVDEAGKLTWAENTTLNLNIGNQNSTAQQGISYVSKEISGTTYLPDGKQYSAGMLKPAWAAMQAQLSTTSKVNLVDKFENLGSGDQITTPITNKNLGDYDVITGSLEEINKNSSNFLNLTEYLDYMPNYKAFLTANPVTKYSLTGDYNGGMYAAPYFDGNDDIEKYSMMNHNWVKAILDTEIKATGTFKAQAEEKKKNKDYADLIVSDDASAESYMGTTGSYTVDTTDPAGTANAQGVIPTIKLKVNYDAAKTAALDESTELGKAIKAAAGDVKYDGESGNIVDLQNFAIKKSQGAVTGAQLSKILREYIKVAYQKADGSAFYTTLSDVFISASAGWDVDLLVAMGRCVVTCVGGTDGLANAQSVGQVFAVAGRQTTTQRRVDLVALAGELYGIRGLESRYEYTFFDKDGNIKDARADEKTYDTLSKFSKLTKEGLVCIGDASMTEQFKKASHNDLIKPISEGGKYGYTVVYEQYTTEELAEFTKDSGAEGQYKDSEGKVVADKDGFKLDKDGNKIVKNYIDADKNVKADKSGNLLDEKGNKIFDSWKAATINTNASGIQTFMLHDYVQTQTKVGLTGTKGETNPDVYNFGPVVNAVSKWDVNGNNTIEADEYFRFTESWRSVKNTGFCVPKSITGNKDKLSAVLAFIDYLFSTDGQLLMSYGPQSTNGNGENANGWWYATEATGVTLDTIADKVADATNYAPAQYSVKAAYKAQYFVYNGKIYTGTAYNGTQVPTLTTLNKTFYLGKEITVSGNKIQMGAKEGSNILVSEAGNYTNYARKIIGSTLPIGNKNQGFEYQATATVGISGAATVTKALLNGTLKHVKLTLDQGESAWYLIAPTALPMNKNQQDTLKNANQTKISGTYFYNNSKTNQTTNIFIDLLFYGLGSSKNICGQQSLGNYTTNNTGAKLVALLNASEFNYRLGIFRTGWYSINDYYKLGYNLAD